MARIRSVKPGFFTSLDIAELDLAARLHFVGLWTYADDEGRGVDDPRLIKAAIWPLDVEIGPDDVETMQAHLAAAGRIVRYQADGRRYFQVVNWGQHQKPNRPQESKYPAPPDRMSTHGSFTDDSVNDHTDADDDGSQEGRGGERRGEDSCAAGAKEGLLAAISTAIGQQGIPPPDTRARDQLELAVADIALHGATPHDVPQRAREYRRRWPNAALTPMALAKHWPDLAPQTTSRPEAKPYDPTPALVAAGLEPS